MRPMVVRLIVRLAVLRVLTEPLGIVFWRLEMKKERTRDRLYLEKYNMEEPRR